MPARTLRPQTSSPPVLPSADEIRAILGPYLPDDAPPELIPRLSAYLQLLYTWNFRMNLTAVRNPEELVRLHLSECLLAAGWLPPGTQTVLDYGSGAGLPGIPAAALRPEARFILAESQGKKAGFLREAVRQVGLENARVWGGRVENLPRTERYDAVMLRAVDRMEAALAGAVERIQPRGTCIVLTSMAQQAAIRRALPGLTWTARNLPASDQRVVLLGAVPA
jgi:16S rRNA (guanine527-N7)-methyltransferase